ncbi:endonuclease [Nocardioides lianchengensis]|uniref:Endonuclease I n=1 Tax=Nocardioides lianchengensis TaxID=1045774 RepID=A0A1G6QS94_9ACTN|nr:endonuclease [Nocardioides lianchengensis]NYG10510.1 endonuclease I [Nocardioides lianchengensis]SDC95249.1 Endonuclease I [Nocardioides lianchengensis]
MSRAARVPALLLVPLLAAVLALVNPLADGAHAAGEIGVASARAGQDGSVATVRGYVVGQPTSATSVVTSGYPSDYALALADAPGVTDTSQMVYVQVPSAFRATWGLKSHPELLGRRVDVTGALVSYFSRPGVTGASAFALADGAVDPEPDPDPDPDPQPGTGEYDETYYADAVGKTGPELEAALHTIISTGVTKLSYAQVWDALKETDEDPANPSNVIELYTGDSIAKSANGGGVDQWNREHVWAKSHGDFGTATGPGTDVHHLRPEDVSVNSDRGNLDFDNGGTENDEAPGNFADGDSWEPRDAVKGDVARMILYMSVRYEGGDGFADLEVNEVTGNGSAPHIGKLSTLLAWSAADPVDAFEMRRNDVIFESYQFNRNPFIDHPEWATEIWGSAA